MAASWNRYRQTVERAVTKFGRNITVIDDSGPADSTDPLGPAAAQISIPWRGIFVRPSGYIKLGESFYLDPAMWQEAEKIVLVLSHLSHRFERFTKVRDSEDNQTYKIFKVEELAPGDVPIMLYLGLRS